MKKSFEIKYHEVEKEHFWFRARRSYIIQLLKNNKKDAVILDIGCSSGILLKELIKAGFNSSNLYGVDISDIAINNCKRNGLKNTYVMDAQEININLKFDIIIASDCLEHLKNDHLAIKNWYKLLKQNGTIYVFVPAFKILWSKHDVVNMHHRRYSQKTLTTILKDNSFDIVKSSYWNFSLFIPILMVRILSKFYSLEKKKNSGDLNYPKLFNKFLYRVICVENALLKQINFPFGVSVFCIGKKGL